MSRAQLQSRKTRATSVTHQNVFWCVGMAHVSVCSQVLLLPLDVHSTACTGTPHFSPSQTVKTWRVLSTTSDAGGRGGFGTRPRYLIWGGVACSDRASQPSPLLQPPPPPQPSLYTEIVLSFKFAFDCFNIRVFVACAMEPIVRLSYGSS